MDAKITEICEILESLDENPSVYHENLESLSADSELIPFLVKNLNSYHIRILRQLLEHTPRTVLQSIMMDPILPHQLLTHLLTNQITYDLIKVLSELYDSETYDKYLNSETINKLVNALGGCSEQICECLLKVLIFISDKRLKNILQSENSRFFGEMLILRLNWTIGVERKYIINTIKTLVWGFPKFFYLNDLKMIADIVIGFLENCEKDVADESFSILDGIFRIKDFEELNYRVENIKDILETHEKFFCDGKNNLMNRINGLC